MDVSPYVGGETVTAFNPIPDYWGEVSDEELMRGDAAIIVKYVPGVSVPSIERHFVRWDLDSDSREKAYPDDENLPTGSGTKWLISSRFAADLNIWCQTRVARLVSRGFARNRTEYYQPLSNADQDRSSSSADDGRGHLSERALWDFCEFTLRVMADQIAFMEQLLDLDDFERRIEHYVRVVDAQVAPEADRVFLLLREALLRGEFPRGDAARIVGASDRTGRSALTVATEAGLLVSDTPNGAVRLGLPAKVRETYFPQLFPNNQTTGTV